MLFTDSFVQIHLPKTGGSFVTDVLYRLYQLEWNESVRQTIASRGEAIFHGKYGKLVHHRRKHGTCRDIPEGHRNKLILSTVRNPYDHYLSEYHFGWWRRPGPTAYFQKLPQFNEIWPTFPFITFEQYVRLMNYAFCERDPNFYSSSGIGFITQRFINFYSRDPEHMRARIDAIYLNSKSYEDDLFRISFIVTNQLNRQLYEFLREIGYPESELQFILELSPFIPGHDGRNIQEQDEHHRRSVEANYTLDLKQAVRMREQLLFAMFPNFDT